MRHIAIVSPNYFPRTCGVGDQSASLSLELLRRGDDVTILTRAPAEPNPLAPHVRVLGFDDRGPSSVAREILKWLEHHPSDEVIVQYTPQMFNAWRFGSRAIPWLVRELRRRRIPVTFLAHELYLPWSFRPDLLAAAMTQRLQLAACARNVPKLAVTTRTRMSLLGSWMRFIPGAAPLELVRIGANVSPVPWAPSQRGFRLGTFSTLAVGRRFDVLLEAFAHVGRAMPDAELWLLGDLVAREDRMTREFARAVARHPAANRIHTPGKQPLSDIAAAIASFHAYLFPVDTGANTRSSTLPIALGSGVPVVATRGSETDGIFEDQRNILFAPSLSAEAFAGAVLRLRREPELASALSRGARALYETHLAWPKIADALTV